MSSSDDDDFHSIESRLNDVPSNGNGRQIELGLNKNQKNSDAADEVFAAEPEETQVYTPTREELNNVIDLDDFRQDYKNMRPGLLTKTRVTIAIVALFFIALILVPALTPLGELLPSNGLTRTDVGKFRVDVLETPSLKRIENRTTTLNSSVAMEQLGWSTMFRAYDEHNHHAYFKLTKTDFEKIQISEDGSLPQTSEKTVSHYSFQKHDGKIFVLKNDQQIAELTGIAPGDIDNWNLTAYPPLIFNYGKSAVLYRTGKTTKESPAVAYIENLDKPAAVLVPEFQYLESANADRFGKQFFALSNDTISDTALTQRKLIGANFDYKPPAVAAFETGVLMETKLFHCAPAAALALVDAEKFRVISARNGQPFSVNYFRDVLDAKQMQELSKNQNPNVGNEGNQPGASNGSDNQLRQPQFEILPGVPAAIFGDKLVDMRTGKIVDTLRNFSKFSTYAVDYKNQIFYYSSNEVSGHPTASYMTINVYNLNKVSLINQVLLGPQSMRAPTRKETADVEEQRLDSIQQMFTTGDGKLIVLTAPADEARINHFEIIKRKNPELTLRVPGIRETLIRAARHGVDQERLKLNPHDYCMFGHR